MNLYPLGRGAGGVALVDSLYYLLGQTFEGEPGDRIVEGYGVPGIAAFADALHDGNLPQQRHAGLFGQPFAAILAKEVVFVLG